MWHPSELQERKKGSPVTTPVLSRTSVVLKLCWSMPVAQGQHSFKNHQKELCFVCCLSTTYIKKSVLLVATGRDNAICIDCLHLYKPLMAVLPLHRHWAFPGSLTVSAIWAKIRWLVINLIWRSWWKLRERWTRWCMGWWGSLRTRTALAPTVLWPTPPTSWWLESVRLWQWGCPDTRDTPPPPEAVPLLPRGPPEARPRPVHPQLTWYTTTSRQKDTIQRWELFVSLSCKDFFFMIIIRFKFGRISLLHWLGTIE